MEQQPLTIAVDPSRRLGRIKPLHGVGGGPLNGDFWYDTSEYYRAAGIPFGRTHDIERPYGAGEYVDIHCIFPNFNADENDPDNYNFTFTDLYLKAMTDAGTTPFYRLGSTIEQEPVKRYVHPPKDFAKWGRICSHIIAHYNEGWADGYHMNIQYWEIWNEPELGKCTWTGTPEQFLEFYETAARILKADHPDVKIGGCAFVRPVGELTERLVVLAKEKNVPLDFLTWHQYFTDAEWVGECAWNVDKMLRRHGMEHVESICDEWNYVRKWDDTLKYSVEVHKNAHGAAFTAAAMAVLQNTPVAAAMYYDAQVRSQLWNGLFTPGPVHVSGLLHPVTVEKPYYAFTAWNELCKAGDQLTVTADEGVFAVAAGTETEITLLVVNYSDNGAFGARDYTPKQLALDFGGEILAAEAKVTDIYRTDESVPFDGKTLTLGSDSFAVLKVKVAK